MIDKDVMVELLDKLDSCTYRKDNDILSIRDEFYYIGFLQDESETTFIFRTKNPPVGTPLLETSFGLNYFKDRSADQIFSDILLTLDLKPLYDISKI